MAGSPECEAIAGSSSLSSRSRARQREAEVSHGIPVDTSVQKVREIGIKKDTERWVGGGASS